MKKMGRERLAEYRDRTRLKQSALAVLVGITDSYLSQILSGRRRPGLDLALEIEDQTGIPTSSWKVTRVAKSGKGRRMGRRKTSIDTGLTNATSS